MKDFIKKNPVAVGFVVVMVLLVLVGIATSHAATNDRAVTAEKGHAYSDCGSATR